MRIHGKAHLAAALAILTLGTAGPALALDWPWANRRGGMCQRCGQPEREHPLHEGAPRKFAPLHVRYQAAQFALVHVQSLR